MNIKLFTHNDLDGIGCAILGKLSFDEVDTEYCGYNNINEKVKEFVDNEEFYKYNHVYITDISINEELAETITNLFPKNFTLIDHHPTALHLNKYEWCNVKIEDETEKVSGTSLFYKELIENAYIENDAEIQSFVENIKRYDTWLWATKYDVVEPKKLNDLLYLYGREKFVDRVIEQFEDDGEFRFTKTDKLLLELQEEKTKKYIESKDKEMIVKEIQGFKVGIVFAEQYISELGNTLAVNHSELDFIAIISSNTISYRGIKDNIDLGMVAKQFGGGGHPKASGSQIDKNKKLEYIESLFS